MKTRFYKLSLPFLLIAVLASCMKSETEPVSMPVSGRPIWNFLIRFPIIRSFVPNRPRVR